MLRNSTQPVCLNGSAVKAKATTKLFLAGPPVALPVRARATGRDMLLRAVIMMAAMETGAWAAGAGAAEARSVTVCIGSIPGLPSTYLSEQMAAQIFSGIGVRLAWHDFGHCPASPESIKISFADQAPKRVSAGALAYALPYEGAHIVVLSGRVKRIQRVCTQQLLAYVLVHEISHILERIDRHSESGIMKAHWDAADYVQMQHRALVFAAEDVDLIHRGLDARAGRLAGKAPVLVAAQ